MTLRSLRARLARLGAGAIQLALFARVDADATTEEVRSAVPPADPRFD